MTIVTNVYPDFGILCLKDRIAEIAWFKIKFFPKSRSMWNMIFTVLTEIGSVCVNYCGSIIKKPACSFSYTGTMITILYFLAYSAIRQTVGPGTLSAEAYHFLSCPGQK